MINYEITTMPSLYEKGVEEFFTATNYQAQNEQSKQSIRKKMLPYQKRADQLRKMFIKQNVKQEVEQPKMQMDLQGISVMENPGVRWSDVKGLDLAKETLELATVLPSKFPHLFTGFNPWKGILLFGPPGSGKSYLAKAVATEAYDSVAFFVVSGDLASQWQAEKHISNVFTLARQHKPSIIFIDDVDWFFSFGSDGARIKAEFSVQMDGVGNDMDGILVIGATTKPWVLHSSILRRFEKRIFIPLPEEDARLEILRKHLRSTPHELTEQDLKALAEKTHGYSVSNILLAVRVARMQPLRKALTATHFKNVRGPSSLKKSMIMNDLLTPCSPGDVGAFKMTGLNVPQDKLFNQPLTMSDIQHSLASIRPTVKAEDLKKYENFTEGKSVEE